MGDAVQKSHEKKNQPTYNVKNHVQLRSSKPQTFVTNFVFSHFTVLCHLLNSDESDNNSDSVVTTYAVAVGNTSLMSAHLYDIRWVDSIYCLFTVICGGKS